MLNLNSVKKEDITDAKQAADWNRRYPEGDIFTKQEYSQIENFDSYAMRYWNTVLPEADQFTKLEHSQGKNFNCGEIVY